jgi:glycosyltransferase involved in cell wall biosynthesis
VRVAIIHDWLNQNGGAEKVLEVLHRIYPEAPIFTSLYTPERLPEEYRCWDIRTSFLQRFRIAHRRHQALLPLYPTAFRGFDLSGFDVIISNSSGFAHGVRVPAGSVHVNYCLTPPRFLWFPEAYLAREQVGGLVRRALPPMLKPLRDWDAESVQDVDCFVAISEAVRERIRLYYGRESALVFPPVETSAFAPCNEVEDFYLIASRLVPYKRVDLAVQAFTRMGRRLVVAGTGRDRAALEAMAGPTVRFEGWVTSERLKDLLSHCRAFVFPGEEDFGIAPLEAQASGRPVIAYAAGGALETVVDRRTGVFFHQPTPEALMDAVERLEDQPWDPDLIRRHAERFDTSVFREQFAAVVEEQVRGLQ